MLLWVTISLAIKKLEGRCLGHFETRQKPDVVTIMFHLPLTSFAILSLTAVEVLLALWHTISSGVFPYLFLTVVLIPGKVIKNETISS